MKEITKPEIAEAFRVLHIPPDKSSIEVVTRHLLIWYGLWNHPNKKQIHKQIKGSVAAYVHTYIWG